MMAYGTKADLESAMNTAGLEEDYMKARETLKKMLAKGWGIASQWGRSRKAYILESKAEMRFFINREGYYGLKYLVFNRETGKVVYVSHSYNDCVPILKAICTE